MTTSPMGLPLRYSTASTFERFLKSGWSMLRAMNAGRPTFFLRGLGLGFSSSRGWDS